MSRVTCLGRRVRGLGPGSAVRRLRHVPDRRGARGEEGSQELERAGVEDFILSVSFHL